MMDWFNPEYWNISFYQYESIWTMLMVTLFKGIWAKIIASLCLFLSVYSVIRRKFRPIIAFLSFITACVFAYAGTVMTWFN